MLAVIGAFAGSKSGIGLGALLLLHTRTTMMAIKIIEELNGFLIGQGIPKLFSLFLQFS